MSKPGVIFHWPALTASWLKANPGQKAVDGIRGMHRARGYNDIGYHYLIGLDTNGNAQVYDGRPDHWPGAHTYGPGNAYLGISVLYPMDGPLSDKLFAKAGQLLADLAKRYGFAINDRTVTGHRDWMPNQCPGDPLYARLPELRKLALSLKAGNAPPQAATPAPVAEEPQVGRVKLVINGKEANGLRVNSQALIHAGQLADLGVSVRYDAATDTVHLSKAKT